MAGEMMSRVIPPEMWQKYSKRSGDKELARGEVLCNSHGFMVYRIRKGAFEIVQCYGDGKYWGEEAQKLARFYCCKTVRVFTRRNPSSFVRRWKGLEVAYTCLEGVLEDVTPGMKLGVNSHG